VVITAITTASLALQMQYFFSQPITSILSSCKQLVNTEHIKHRWTSCFYV